MRENLQESEPEKESGKRFEVRKIESNNSTEGFVIFQEFMRNLREKYPDRYYKTEEIVNRIERMKTISYVAFSEDEKVVGVMNGNEKEDGFHGQWFVIDPEYQNSGISQEIWGMAFKDFDKISILTDVFGLDKESSQEEKVSKQKALTRYYEKLGFTPDVNSESYKYSKVPGGPMPMVWVKEEI